MLDKIIGIICDRGAYLIEFIFSRFITADYEYSSVTDITKTELNKITCETHVKGFILDVDETLRFSNNSISQEVEKWITNLKLTNKVIVVTNNYDKDMIRYFTRRGIKIISMAFKPCRKGFLLACKEMNLKPCDVAMIGNNSVTDILGGKRLGMVTIRIKKRKKKK